MLKTGQIFLMKCGSFVTINKYVDAKNIFVTMSSGFKTKVQSKQITDKTLKDPNYPSVLGIGYFGIGKYGVKDKSYQVWFDMLKRCYSENIQRLATTYIGCTVIYNWHNYQNFAKWYEKRYFKGCQIDKDILFHGNKIYSPETCILVPREINSFFIKPIKKLPLGVAKHNNGYTPSLRPLKTVYTIKEALDIFWNRKYKKLIELIAKYPEYKNVLIDKFELYFLSNYNYKIENGGDS